MDYNQILGSIRRQLDQRLSPYEQSLAYQERLRAERAGKQGATPRLTFHEPKPHPGGGIKDIVARIKGRQEQQQDSEKITG